MTVLGTVFGTTKRKNDSLHYKKGAFKMSLDNKLHDVVLNSDIANGEAVEIELDKEPKEVENAHGGSLRSCELTLIQKRFLKVLRFHLENVRKKVSTRESALQKQKAVLTSASFLLEFLQHNLHFLLVEVET